MTSRVLRYFTGSHSLTFLFTLGRLAAFDRERSVKAVAMSVRCASVRSPDAVEGASAIPGSTTGARTLPQDDVSDNIHEDRHNDVMLTSVQSLVRQIA